MSDEEDWVLTTEKIERTLADVRAAPCPRSAHCPDAESRVQFSLHIIAEAALSELVEHRATMNRLEEWAEQLETTGEPGHDRRSGVGPFIAAELRNRMKGV